jgi:tRNA G46 methylase TrmB
MARPLIVKAAHPSRSVNSSQDGVHPRLDSLVDTHLSRAWQAPLHPRSVNAFEALQARIGSEAERLVFDSGCGTGESTRMIARTHPDCLLPSFWRLALRAGWRLRHHYLLYPNPWPKPGQLQRRWHAHPVFPDLLRLGGRLELRCNWEIYALEFAAAANRVLDGDTAARLLAESAITTPFERKYRASGHPLYSVSVSCVGAAV